ncbi:MAG: hypothetical protein A2Z16_09915 [Chloroflexi bacterium RBG_16_54_18]|nr:MAG: hypothetical protein A2Z16_09915 [Chloroflexi bacterium RBG_16_54_18]
MDRNQPSLIRTILADTNSYQAAILTVFLWVILIVDRIFPTYSVLFTYIVLVVSIASAALLLVRYRKVMSLFEACIEAPGVIEDVAKVRGYISINCEFTFRGERFAIERSYVRSKFIERLAPGNQVTVLVDPDNLQQSIIRDIYID